MHLSLIKHLVNKNQSVFVGVNNTIPLDNTSRIKMKYITSGHSGHIFRLRIKTNNHFEKIITYSN